ncbi:MAG: hypothetical protein ACFBRM_14375 [Pikeienuella sp.]
MSERPDFPALYEALLTEVRRVFREEWNPIGIAGLPYSEYDAYAPPVAHLLAAGEPLARIHDALTATLGDLGLAAGHAADPARIWDIAQQLTAHADALRHDTRSTGPLRLVPELCVTDFAMSLEVYTQVYGFSRAYERQGFALLELGPVAVMLEQLQADSWLLAPADWPLGRGMNLEIPVPALDPLLTRASARGMTPFWEPETVWYRAGPIYLGQYQAIFADPDGYLLRFAEDLGAATTPPEGARVSE